MALRSSSGVEIGLISNNFTSVFRMFGVKNAGNDGPNRISLMPRWSRANITQTAFCSYQEIINESGNSFNDVSAF